MLFLWKQIQRSQVVFDLLALRVTKTMEGLGQMNLLRKICSYYRRIGFHRCVGLVLSFY